VALETVELVALEAGVLVVEVRVDPVLQIKDMQEVMA
jgi:hypothetical protein